MVATRTGNSAQEVIKLVKKPILFDDDTENYRVPQLKSVIGTHGARIDDVVQLALNGRFVGGVSDLAGEFYVTPNKDYAGWSDSEIADEIESYEFVDPFLKGIDYSEQRPAEDSMTGMTGEVLPVKQDGGVVIAFNRKALMPGMKLGPWIHDDSELILPRPPSIEAIHGIYPVERTAADMLMRALQKIK